MKQSKKKNNSIGKWILTALLLLAVYIYNNHTKTDIRFGDDTADTASSAVVHFIDVGQADAACIVLPGGETMLIDAGCNASEDQLLAYLSKYRITHIDYAIFTHPHEDHIGGADAVLGACEIDHVLLPDAAAATSTYEIMLDCIATEGCSVRYAVPRDTYTLGDASFTILAPITVDEKDLNNASIMLSFRYGDTTFLFTGDAESSSESAVLAEYAAALDADVLKVGHHGSSTSSSDAFLAAVSPDAAVISCGTDNDYGHPHTETLESLGNYTEHIFRTDRLGSVRIYTDGHELVVQSDREDPHS